MSPRAPVSRQSAGFIFVVLSALALSFKGIIAKVAFTYDVDPETLVAMRLYFSCATLIPMLTLRRQWVRPSRPDAASLALLGAVGVTGAMVTSMESLQRIDAGLSSLLTYTYPALIVFGGALALRSTPARSTLAALALTLGGLALLLQIPAHSLDNPQLWPGVGYALASALFCAYYHSRSVPLINKLGANTALAYAMFAGTITLTLWRGWRPLPTEWQPWAYAAVLGIVTGAIPHLLLAHGKARIGAENASITATISPAFAVSWGVLLLNESLSGWQMLGMAAQIAGIVLLRRGHREQT